MRLYSLFDSKAGSFGAPWTSTSDATAARAVVSEAQNPQSMIGRHPGDFQLFYVASMDEASGVIEAVSPLQPVGLVSSLIAVSNGEYHRTQSQGKKRGSK